MREIQKKCEYCGKDFITTSRVRQCCSSECSYKLGAKKTLESGKGFKRIYKVDDDFLTKETNEKYYFLGLMASDGCLSEYNKSICISQSGENGLNLIKYIKDILKSNYNILEYYPKKGRCSYSLNIRSNKLWNDLMTNNITPKKTYIYSIPDYIINDIEKLKYFLIGYIDGDGCIGVYQNMLTISFVCSYSMKNQLEKIPLFENSSFNKKGKVIEIRYNGYKALKFCDFLYKDISVYKSYKYQIFKDYKENMFDISPKMKYNFIQEELFSALDNDPNLDCMRYAKEHNINFQYVYRNRKLWRNKNEQNSK